MKSLLLTLMMLIISSAAFASDFNIDGRWVGSQGGGTVTFEFRADGKNLIGLYLGSGAGDEKKEIQSIVIFLLCLYGCFILIANCRLIESACICRIKFCYLEIIPLLSVKVIGFVVRYT